MVDILKLGVLRDAVLKQIRNFTAEARRAAFMELQSRV
jgi:hypothetical protein